MKRFVTLLALLVLLVGAAAAVWVYTGVRSPYRGYSADEQFVDIRPGTGTRAIGERLVEAGVVRDQVTFRIALLMSGRATRLKAEWFVEGRRPKRVYRQAGPGRRMRIGDVSEA